VNASRALQPCLLAVVVGSITAYALADSNAALWVFGVPGAIASWWFTRGHPPRTVPRELINSMLIAAVGWAALRVTRDRFEVEVFSEFVTMIMVVKLLDRRWARDDAQVLTLAAFLSVGAMLTSNSLSVGLLLILLLPLLMLTVVLQQIDSAERRSAGDRFAGRSGPTVRRDVRRLVASGWAAAMLISIVAFLLMPRSLGTRAFGQWGNASVGSVVGFNDEIQLGTGGLISQSAEPVMDVRFTNDEGRNLGEPLRTFYLRGAVLDDYRYGRWVRSASLQKPELERRAIPFGTTSPMAIGGSPGSSSYVARITLRQAARNGTHLFTVWRPEKLLLHTPVRSLFHDIRDDTLLVTGQEGKIEYSVWVDEIRDAQPPAPGEGPPQQPVLPLPLSDRVTDLARSILETAGVPIDPVERGPAENIAAARALEQFFTRERFAYDLNERVPPADVDPTEYFLFETRTGHCEYYASAMAAMARAVGLNARVVTGYVATEFNAATGHYLVRASNAHAWVEAKMAPARWRSFDPTPQADFGRVHDRRDRGVIGFVRGVFETIEFAWIKAVVGFDDSARERIFGGLLPSGGDISAAADRVLDRVQAGGGRLLREASGRAAIVFAAVMVGGTVLSAALPRVLPALLAALGMIGAARFRVGGAGDGEDGRRLAIGRRAVDRAVRRLGFPRPAWRPLHEHATSPVVAEATDREVSAAIDRVARAVYRLRFGPGSLGAGEREAFDRDVQTLRRAARGTRRRATDAPGTPGREGT